MSHIEWDETYFDIADVLAQRSCDPNTKVGAVISRPNKTIASVGYNGLPRGVETKGYRIERPSKYLWMVHAEENALLTATEDLTGYAIHVPIMPCMGCARGIRQRGIIEVVCDEARVEQFSSPKYSDEFNEVRRLFAETGIKLRMYRRNG